MAMRFLCIYTSRKCVELWMPWTTYCFCYATITIFIFDDRKWDGRKNCSGGSILCILLTVLALMMMVCPARTKKDNEKEHKQRERDREREWEREMKSAESNVVVIVTFCCISFLSLLILTDIHFPSCSDLLIHNDTSLYFFIENCSNIQKKKETQCNASSAENVSHITPPWKQNECKKIPFSSIAAAVLSTWYNGCFKPRFFLALYTIIITGVD